MKPCNHKFGGSRKIISPTGPNKHNISILVESCIDCGHSKPIFLDRLTYHERRWLERWNAGIDHWWETYEPTHEYFVTIGTQLRH